MRLLHTNTFALEEFFDEQVPDYAILSHRWQADEVSLQDWQGGLAKEKAGYQKIENCCSQARKDGINYAWIDTCCIDKTSSAELTESINSMYRWYQRAAVCYAYLYDVPDLDTSRNSNFRRSTWWSRGWTLQELIAPQDLNFYNSSWNTIGTKLALADVISQITGIDIAALLHGRPEHFSVAKRFSWASSRITTRIEDSAYSLLGLFGVSMSMLYGEGQKAFMRLQEEIMKNSDDQSIFAWTTTDIGRRGMLAKSPADFKGCHNIRISQSRLNRIPYSITNMGLSVQLLLLPWAMNIYVAALDCESTEHRPPYRIGIFVEILPEPQQFARTTHGGDFSTYFNPEWIKWSKYRSIFVRQEGWNLYFATANLFHGFYLRKISATFEGATGDPREYSLVGIMTPTQGSTWNENKKHLVLKTSFQGVAGIIWYQTASGDASLSAVKIGFDFDFRPVCELGGPLFCPNEKHLVVKQITRATFSADQGIGWMDQEDGWTFKGDRREGLHHVGRRSQVEIKLRLIDGKMMWVVDVRPKHGSEEPVDPSLISTLESLRREHGRDGDVVLAKNMSLAQKRAREIQLPFSPTIPTTESDGGSVSLANRLRPSSSRTSHDHQKSNHRHSMPNYEEYLGILARSQAKR